MLVFAAIRQLFYSTGQSQLVIFFPQCQRWDWSMGTVWYYQAYCCLSGFSLLPKNKTQRSDGLFMNFWETEGCHKKDFVGCMRKASDFSGVLVGLVVISNISWYISWKIPNPWTWNTVPLHIGCFFLHPHSFFPPSILSRYLCHFPNITGHLTS